MNWTKWKVGLLIAIGTGICSGLIGLAVGITWKAFWILMGVNLGKDLGLYLAKHPIDTISFETSRITKDENTGKIIEENRKTTISQPATEVPFGQRTGPIDETNPTTKKD